MPQSVLIVLILLIGFVVGFGLGCLLARQQSTGSASASAAVASLDPQQLAAQLDQTRQQLKEMTDGYNDAARRLAAAQATLDSDKDRIGYLQKQIDDLGRQEHERVQAQQQSERQHQAELADQRQRHLEEINQKDRKEAESNSQILKLLSPVADRLDMLQRRVTSMEEGRKKESGQMSEQLRSLSQSGTALSEQTRQLASVLTNNQRRGQWGEMSLRNLVEAAGMTEHVDFDTQVVVATGADSSSRPDMVIHMPDGKQIPIDSKTPFQSYERAMATDDSTIEGRRERERLLDDNVKAIRKHIDDLGKRDYAALLDNTPGFTIAFLPTEAVLSAALETDPNLLSYAYEHKVALCSPVSLWAVLQAVASAWNQQSLSDDAKQLFKLCQQLYAGFRTLGDHVGKMGRSLERTVSSYNGLVGNLERTILPKARKLDTMDPKKIEEIQQINSDKGQVRKLTSSEFTDEPEVTVRQVTDGADGAVRPAASTETGESND